MSRKELGPRRWFVLMAGVLAILTALVHLGHLIGPPWRAGAVILAALGVVELVLWFASPIRRWNRR